MQTIKSFKDISSKWIENFLNLEEGAISEFRINNSWDTLISQVAILDISSKTNKAAIPSSLFVKISKADLSNEMARLGEKEVKFYQNVKPAMNLNCFPTVYHTLYNYEEKIYNLVFENLTETHFQSEWPVPPLMQHCVMAVECLARIHAFWWDHNDLESVTAQFESMQDVLTNTKQQEEIGNQFIDFLDDRLPERRRAIIRDFYKNIGPYSERYITHKNLTLVHNDPHFGNFHFPRSVNNKIKIIDWQCYGNGVGTDDLAYMMAVHWYPDRRREYELKLLKTYHNVLLQNNIRSYSFEELLKDYKVSIINQLTIPIRQWKAKLWAGIWFHHLERIFLAYEDFGCADYLR